MIQFAEQQLIGYLHAKRGYGLEDLIISMGLSLDEWKEIKEKSNLDITDEEREEIEEHFAKSIFRQYLFQPLLCSRFNGIQLADKHNPLKVESEFNISLDLSVNDGNKLSEIREKWYSEDMHRNLK